MTRHGQVTPPIEAQMTSVDLNNLSFEMQEVRSLKYFGAASFPTPEAYWDTGYTHPNFELRVLTVNDLVSNTPLSHRLLQSFLKGRSSDSKQGVLFQAPQF
jgi:hypothetical protein